jgi:nucleoside-diphosphate-sugar epimerase
LTDCNASKRAHAALMIGVRRSAAQRSTTYAATPAEANIWYTDRDRGLVDIGRLMQDTEFRSRYLMDEAYADYLEWMRRTPEFFDRLMS